MKRILPLISIALLLFTCSKKDTPKKTSPDITGTFALYSLKSPNLDVTADTYPCMAENVIVFNSDSTFVASYKGADSCYVTAIRGYVNGVGPTMIGIAGQPSQSGSWHQNQNDLYLVFAIGTSHKIITTENGKLVLKETATYHNLDGTAFTISTVNIKK
jgi:hypothetical protein